LEIKYKKKTGGDVLIKFMEEKMEKKVKFKDLSVSLKIAVVVSYFLGIGFILWISIIILAILLLPIPN